MGSKFINFLRNIDVWDRFTAIVGPEIEPLKMVQKTDFDGTDLKFTLNKFENCTVVGLPHPSSGRGITNEYIEFCGSELNPIISQFKKDRGIA
ncbi:MAG: hypothetical protein U1F28_01530 [Acinetobacter sp.]